MPREQHIIRAATQIRLDSAVDVDELAFMGRRLIQVTLPHSNPGNVQAWGRSNGKYSLVIQPGMYIEDGEPKSRGLPYGSYPRLVLAWITTEAVRTKSRRLVLGGSLSAFMHELGLTPSGGRWGTIWRLRDQMRRLFSSHITLNEVSENTDRAYRLDVVDHHNLWWNPKQPDEPVLFNSTIVLKEDFFHEITERPVPIDMRALKALKQSPLGLDLYMWLTHRVSYLRHEVVISWDRLHEQFGADYSETKNFARKARRELRNISVVWPELKYETPRGRLVLRPCPTHVPRLKS